MVVNIMNTDSSKKFAPTDVKAVRPRKIHICTVRQSLEKKPEGWKAQQDSSRSSLIMIYLFVLAVQIDRDGIEECFYTKIDW